MKDFKKLLIWSKGMEITRESYNLVSSWPSFEKFNLGNQIIRAAISIPSNIAEGNSRMSEKDKKRFIEIALGSAFELETQLYICFDQNYLSEKELNIYLDKVQKIQKMLYNFRTTLSHS